MGILDDAIREHLDLKRRHGAQEVDVRELEDEAFGEGELADPFAAGSAVVATAPADAPDATEIAETSDLDAPETPPPPGPATPAPGVPLPDAEDPLPDEPTGVAPALEPEWDAEVGLVEEDFFEGEESIEPAESEGRIEPVETASIEPPDSAESEPPEPTGAFVPPPPPVDGPASRPGGETARIVGPSVEQHSAPPEPPSDLLDAPDLGEPDEAALDDSDSYQVELETTDTDEADLDVEGELYDFATDADFADQEHGGPAPDHSPATVAAGPPQSPAQPAADAPDPFDLPEEEDEAELDEEEFARDEAEPALDDDDDGDNEDELDRDAELGKLSEGELADEDLEDDEQDDALLPREFADPEKDEDPLERSSEFAPAEDDDSGELWFEQSEPEDFDFKD